MPIVMVTDIFGRTPALEQLCGEIGGDAQILDPYAGKTMTFGDEAEAYAFFMEHVGLDAYVELLTAKLADLSGSVALIGFSVGASAVWRLSGTPVADKVTWAACFYGSQIRHWPEVVPQFPIELILPAQEPGFSVDELADRLSGRKNVTLRRTPYGHGFMNPLSGNFSPEGYAQYAEWLRQGLSAVSHPPY